MVDVGPGLVVFVVVVVLVVMAVMVAAVDWEVVLPFPLVGQELVDEAFCLVVRRGWRAAEMGWDRFVGDEGALAAVGIC